MAKNNESGVDSLLSTVPLEISHLYNEISGQLDYYSNHIHPPGVSPEQSKHLLESELDQMLEAASLLFKTREAKKSPHLPNGLKTRYQEKLFNTVEQSFKTQKLLLDCLSDPSGETARKNRVSYGTIQDAFTLYDPRKPITLSLCRPAVYLWIAGVAQYQATDAPYGGKVDNQTGTFYQKYTKISPNSGLETVDEEQENKKTTTDELEWKLFSKSKFSIAYLGCGAGERIEKRIIQAINFTRKILTMPRKLKNGRQTARHIGIDPYPPSQIPTHFDEYHPFKLENLTNHPELHHTIDEALAYGSPMMDILEIVKRMSAYRGISEILKRNGIFKNDQAFPYGHLDPGNPRTSYSSEIVKYHTEHPLEPEFMFKRKWDTGDSDPPEKEFFASPIELEYFLMEEAGLSAEVPRSYDIVEDDSQPEKLSFRDAQKLVDEMNNRTDPDEELIPHFDNYKRGVFFRSRWLARVIKTVYQTQDKFGRKYNRWVNSWQKIRNPNPYFVLMHDHLNSSPAFAPKPEE